jgi:hypothetical protein
MRIFVFDERILRLGTRLIESATTAYGYQTFLVPVLCIRIILVLRYVSHNGFGHLARIGFDVT